MLFVCTITKLEFVVINLHVFWSISNNPLANWCVANTAVYWSWCILFCCMYLWKEWQV